jgi:uncharacterized membrane protein YbhN (UPF0104 family)
MVSRRLQLLPTLLGSLLFGVSIWAIAHELRHYHIREIWQSLLAIPDRNLLLAIGLTGLNYVVFTGYDTLAVRYVHHPLSYRRTAIAAIISTAISNSIGFALLSGSAIRYRLYATWSLSAAQITQIIAFCNLSFWLGLFAVGGVMFLVEPLEIPDLLNLPFDSVHPIGGLFLIVITAYLLWNVLSHKSLRLVNFTFPHLSVKLSIAQLVVASLDWALSAAVLYALLLSSAPFSYPGFFGIYLLAQLAGVISNVPGGLGVFETVMSVLLSPSIPSTTLWGALLAYRAIYYFLPMAIAVVMLGIYEIQQQWKQS